MSETSLSDYDPNEWSPTQPPILCCATVQKIDTSPNSAPPHLQLQHLHNQLFQQRGKIPTSDNLDLPLTRDFYNWGVVRVSVTENGTKETKKRWFAPTGSENNGYFVLIPKHKVYTAQRKRIVEKKEEPGSTCRFGQCPNHSSVGYEATWYAFIEEKDSESRLGGTGNSNDETRFEEQPEQSIDTPEATFETESEEGSIEPASPISRGESEQPSFAPQPSISDAHLTHPSAASQPSISNTHLLQSSGGNPYQSLRDKVKTGKGLPCDDCARVRRPCSRKMTPGGGPKCDRCQRRNIQCTWNTVGSGKRDNRSNR
jgi:hypothetical protein